MGLTTKQLEVLDFIKRFIASNGYSPTVREIAAGLGLKSPSTVQEHLRKLMYAGVITINKNKSRTIELLVQNEYLVVNEKLVSIPLLDTPNSILVREYIEVPLFMLNDYDTKKLSAYKKDKSIYIINHGLQRTMLPSLVVKNEKFEIEDMPKDDIYGNIISEFKVY